MDELELLGAKLDKLAVDPRASMSYDLLAGGLVWSDEIPACDLAAAQEIPFPGLGQFRALLNHRNSLILGESGKRFQDVWERALRLCPNWPGFISARQEPALAQEARSRSEAARRSFEELDERYQKQQQTRASTTTA